jgi:hypothetical protein
MKKSLSLVSGRLWCASDSHLAENQLLASYLHAARFANQFVATSFMLPGFFTNYIMRGAEF